MTGFATCQEVPTNFGPRAPRLSRLKRTFWPERVFLNPQKVGIRKTEFD